MRILIIRHGDPDYEIDGLTEKGKREAALLAKRLACPFRQAQLSNFLLFEHFERLYILYRHTQARASCILP